MSDKIECVKTEVYPLDGNGGFRPVVIYTFADGSKTEHPLEFRIQEIEVNLS